MPEEDGGIIPSDAVLMSNFQHLQSHDNNASVNRRGGKDKVHIDYVKQAKRDSDSAQGEWLTHGDSVQIKGLLTNISRAKKTEDELMNRYYESREGFQPKPVMVSPRTLDATMAQRDEAMLRTGL